MKLRCVENSIRLRLKKSDIQQLRTSGTVSVGLHFGQQRAFTYSLVIDETAETTNARLEQSTLLVCLPRAVAHHWIDSQEVGIEHRQPVDDHHELHILIEKDFPCLDRENEDKSDTFFELATKKPDVC